MAGASAASRAGQNAPSDGCVFCRELAAGESLAGNPVAAALADAHPLAEGHTLIVSRRHETDFFSLRSDEQDGMWVLLRTMQTRIADQQGVVSFNVGINAGRAAGQTVDLAHIHLIPRREGDQDDPRGGVRWMMPDRANYWD